ncbi:MAG: hypothetical protein HDT06_01165, partial [Bacteroidales bacterium]|nr:hypothetical protein [Bacteroidales bacterium]
RIRTRRRGSDYQYYDNRELLDECNNYKAQVKGGILHLTGLDPENKSIPGFERHYNEYCDKLERLEPEALKTNIAEVAGSILKKTIKIFIYLFIFLFLLVKCVF